MMKASTKQLLFACAAIIVLGSGVITHLIFEHNVLVEQETVHQYIQSLRHNVQGGAEEVEQNMRFIADAEIHKPPVIFLGDSITSGFDELEPEVYQDASDDMTTYVAPLDVANYAFHGDETVSLRWRINNGIVDTQPKVVVILIGSNDLTIGRTVEQTVRGIESIITAIGAHSPKTKILLLGILPHGYYAGDYYGKTTNLKIMIVNAELARLDKHPMVTFLDFSKAFAGPAGTAPPEAIMPRGLHLSRQGYHIWLEFINVTLHKLLSDKER